MLSEKNLTLRLAEVLKGYECIDPDAVMKFIRERSSIREVLIEAYGQIGRHFGPTRPLVKVVGSTEQPDEYELQVLIPTTLGVDEALARLRALDEEWWLDVPAQTRAVMMIDIEFQ